MKSLTYPGRVHTSTATVEVMPEVDDVDVHVDVQVGAQRRSLSRFNLEKSLSIP